MNMLDRLKFERDNLKSSLLAYQSLLAKNPRKRLRQIYLMYINNIEVRLYQFDRVLSILNIDIK